MAFGRGNQIIPWQGVFFLPTQLNAYSIACNNMLVVVIIYGQAKQSDSTVEDGRKTEHSLLCTLKHTCLGKASTCH